MIDNDLVKSRMKERDLMFGTHSDFEIAQYQKYLDEPYTDERIQAEIKAMAGEFHKYIKEGNSHHCNRATASLMGLIWLNGDLATAQKLSYAYSAGFTQYGRIIFDMVCKKYGYDFNKKVELKDKTPDPVLEKIKAGHPVDVKTSVLDDPKVGPDGGLVFKDPDKTPVNGIPAVKEDE